MYPAIKYGRITWPYTLLWESKNSQREFFEFYIQFIMANIVVNGGSFVNHETGVLAATGKDFY